ncbi:YidC/Oxa1 family membrane protein insertase [Streptomyces sp. NBC_01443]|uniref:YidC/Oxa1 family membrane protein insertase n=1 Tax=Streptomyces sp. NBC_01443 TaxID=2903868 RepID=UPI00224E8AC1|nr:YidC/Oxa1 family membrane protein insertase [Streptomyces sp. NBC_01443]MCX4629689.1 YidC/Oxa1 family membrane protein insertase [Streptomyces sp. NBC_01443]
MSVFTSLVVELGRFLEPVLAESATAAAIVLFTVLVRLVLHPLNRAAFRGATPAAGCLPVLLQLPVFFLMYQAFSSSGELLDHRLFAAPLGARWGDALGDGGFLGAQGLVFLGLFAAIAAVAAWSAVRGRRAAALAAAAAASAPVAAVSRAKGKSGVAAEVSAEQQAMLRKLGGVLPLLSFGTLITAAVVPLAAGLYLVTTTAWSVAERAWLQYRKEAAEGRERSSL